jgi:hypothetical protein
MRYSVWLLLTLKVAELSAQDGPVGLVTEISGDVQIERPGTHAPVYESFILYPGDSLVVAANATAAVLFKTGERMIYNRSTRILTKSGPSHPALEKIMKTAQTVKDWLPTASGRLRHRSDASRNLEPVFPRNTALRAFPDSLTWTGIPRRPFTASVRCYQNDFRLDDTVETQSLPLVTSDLETGRTYYWTVAYWDDIHPPAAVWFSVLTPSENASLVGEHEDLLRIFGHDTTSTAYRLLSVKLKMAYALHLEADTELQTLASTSEGNPGYWQLKALLQDVMDYPADALTSLKRITLPR